MEGSEEEGQLSQDSQWGESQGDVCVQGVVCEGEVSGKGGIPEQEVFKMTLPFYCQFAIIYKSIGYPSVLC